MIYDELGLPKENGADDFQDSARLAGLMTIFGFGRKIDLTNYIAKNPTRYVRHPKEEIYDFSRDQTLCLVAGFYFFSKYPYSYVDLKYVTGKDWFTPSHKGHIKRCKGGEANWFENLWLWVDVLFHTYLTPEEEPNQLLAMMMVADKKYLRFWLKHNRHWRESIINYWCGWRNETEFGNHIVKELEKYL